MAGSPTRYRFPDLEARRRVRHQSGQQGPPMAHEMAGRSCPAAPKAVLRAPLAPSCLIPGFDGAIFSLEWKEALWARYFTAAPRRLRQSVRCPAGDCVAIAERGAIQNSEDSLRVLSARYGINQKTVAKWRKRTSVADLPTGPKDAKSTVLTPDEEAIIVAFRRHTLLPLDDCLYSLQPSIPHLSRSSLHRCLQWHDISRLPEVGGDKPAKKKFKAYPLGPRHWA
jgi:hypothetical protein